MTRLALPQSYITNRGADQLEDFETLAEWIVSTGSNAADTVNFKSGTKSVKITSAVGSSGYSSKTISTNFSAKSGMMTYWVYCYTDPVTTINDIVLYFTSDNFATKYFQYTLNADQLRLGWNLIKVAKTDWTVSGGEDWNNTMNRIRIRVDALAGQVASVAFDDLRGNASSIPKVMIQFDDAHSSAYDQGVAYMSSKGLRGTIYVISDFVGTSIYMTKANLDDTYSKGWALGNHTNDHTDLSTYGTQAEVYTRIKTCKDWLVANGYPRAAYHIAYPYGSYNNNVFGAFDQVGMKTGRTTSAVVQKSAPYKKRLLAAYSVANTNTLATVKGYVESAIKTGDTCTLLFHRLVASPSQASEWLISDFQALIDWLLTKKVDIVTIDEWYEGITNPRYRSQPLSRITV